MKQIIERGDMIRLKDDPSKAFVVSCAYKNTDSHMGRVHPYLYESVTADGKHHYFHSNEVEYVPNPKDYCKH